MVSSTASGERRATGPAAGNCGGRPATTASDFGGLPQGEQQAAPVTRRAAGPRWVAAGDVAVSSASG